MEKYEEEKKAGDNAKQLEQKEGQIGLQESYTQESEKHQLIDLIKLPEVLNQNAFT